MKMNFRRGAKAACGAVLIGYGFTCTPGAQAAYVIDFTQVGVNVVANGSGTLDFLGQTFEGFNDPLAIGLNPSIGYLAVGNEDAAGNPEAFGDNYFPITGPASFGTGAFTAASSTSGTVAGVSGAAGFDILPGGYAASRPLISSVTTFDNATLASLGLKGGTYKYTLGSGDHTDFLTVNSGSGIGGVPEPATWAMMLFGFAGLGFLGYRQSRRNVSLALTHI